MEKEIWKDIPEYEGHYQVSNLGNVKSIKFGKERILKFNTTTNGYPSVELWVNNKNKRMSVHALVAIAFLGHKPDGHKIEVDHIDKNRCNNNVNNLQLLTTKEHTNKDVLGSGTGYTFNKPRNKWLAQIKINRRSINLGLFTDKEEASVIYQKAVANTHLYNGDAKAFRLALATVTL
jgi:hypothetical protein